MQECRSVVARHRRPSLLSLLSATAGLFLGVIALAAFPASAQAGGPPPPPTFCNEAGTALSACAGPITSDSSAHSGQQRIAERLQQLRCQDSNDPACAGVGGAAADSVSYEGLSFFVSGTYQHKDRTGRAQSLASTPTPSDRRSASTIAWARMP